MNNKNVLLSTDYVKAHSKFGFWSSVFHVFALVFLTVVFLLFIILLLDEGAVFWAIVLLLLYLFILSRRGTLRLPGDYKKGFSTFKLSDALNIVDGEFVEIETVEKRDEKHTYLPIKILANKDFIVYYTAFNLMRRRKHPYFLIGKDEILDVYYREEDGQGVVRILVDGDFAPPSLFDDARYGYSIWYASEDKEQYNKGQFIFVIKTNTTDAKKLFDFVKENLVS